MFVYYQCIIININSNRITTIEPSSIFCYNKISAIILDYYLLLY
jgi:hypothetical protein